MIVKVTVGNKDVRAQVDTGSQSVWVSRDWNVENFGTPEKDSRGAAGADSSQLKVTGSGTTMFNFWGRVFKNQPVRVMGVLDVPLLIGLRFQRDHGFVLDVGRMRGSFIAGGYLFQGRLNDGSCLDYAEEGVRAVIEDQDVDD